MAELVEVATALTSPCDDAFVCAGINRPDAIAQSGSETCGVGSQLDAVGSDKACHCQTRSFLKRG
jgi:hypothetical protein